MIAKSRCTESAATAARGKQLQCLQLNFSRATLGARARGSVTRTPVEKREKRKVDNLPCQCWSAAASSCAHMRCRGGQKCEPPRAGQTRYVCYGDWRCPKVFAGVASSAAASECGRLSAAESVGSPANGNQARRGAVEVHTAMKASASHGGS